jgi:beta-glucosidase
MVRRLQSSTADLVNVSLTLTNTGKRMGAEVVQLYLGFPASAGEPPKVRRYRIGV